MSTDETRPLFQYYSLVVWWARQRAPRLGLSIDAHDIAQEVFTRALQRERDDADRPTEDGPGMRAWLLRIARHVVQEEQRWEASRPPVPPSHRSSRIPASVSSVGSEVRASERVEQFERWVAAHLDPRKLRLLALMVEGASDKDCGRLLGVSSSRAGDLKTEVRQRLRSAPVELIQDFVHPIETSPCCT